MPLQTVWEPLLPTMNNIIEHLFEPNRHPDLEMSSNSAVVVEFCFIFNFVRLSIIDEAIRIQLTTRGQLKDQEAEIRLYLDHILDHIIKTVWHKAHLVGKHWDESIVLELYSKAFELMLNLARADIEESEFGTRMRTLGAWGEELTDEGKWKAFVERNGFYKCTSPTSEVSQGEECSICQEEYETIQGGENKIATKCGHVFGESCLTQWTFWERNITCPMCRTDLFPI